MDEERIFIGLGSNMGDKGANIEQALDMLEKANRVSVAVVSPFYITAPLGYTDQDSFVNCVAGINSDLKPADLLSLMLDIEDRMGRKRVIRWGPRVIDLDLLLYGQRRISEPGLEVPHPRMQERAFVMVPLADIAPGLVLPGGQPVTRLAEYLKQRQKIKKIT